jgi:hypothetical protein
MYKTDTFRYFLSFAATTFCVFISEFPRIERASFTLDITSAQCLYWFSFPFVENDNFRWHFLVFKTSAHPKCLFAIVEYSIKMYSAWNRSKQPCCSINLV